MRAQPTLASALLIAFVTCTTTMTAPAYADDTLPLLRASSGVPLVKEAIAVRIDHRHAVTEHRQIVKNAAPRQSEGQYEMTTLEGAVVTKFSYWNGEDEIRGELFERAEATQMYNTVTAARRDPGLLEELAPGKFRYRIFPFAPSEAKRVELRWESLLPARGRVVEYRAPLARPNTSVVVDIEGAKGAVIRSDTHEIEVEPLHNGLRVRAVAPRGTPGHFALRYELASTAPVAIVHAEPGQDAFVTLDFPPMETSSAQAARDVTFVVDRSGSESADTLERARGAVRDAIARLPARDRINVIAFDEAATALFPAPRAATTEVVREAQQFVSKIRDGAGTDLAVALRRAFEAQLPGTDRERLVVVITRTA
jgi:Mg-chelatase subunit ChlD